MKISAMIEALEDGKATFGDLDVKMQSDGDETSEEIGGLVFEEDGSAPVIICGKLTYEGFSA